MANHEMKARELPNGLGKHQSREGQRDTLGLQTDASARAQLRSLRAAAAAATRTSGPNSPPLRDVPASGAAPPTGLHVQNHRWRGARAASVGSSSPRRSQTALPQAPPRARIAAEPLAEDASRGILAPHQQTRRKTTQIW